MESVSLWYTYGVESSRKLGQIVHCPLINANKYQTLSNIVFYRFNWIRISPILGSSEALITWTIGPDVESGIYRIRHFGSYKYIFGGVHPYQGTTQPFKVKIRLNR
mgnify:CR=1 FL=1